ncbi:MAG: type II toxin-antitoxin system VapC family toxin [Bacteroidia bacterium]|nr:type II toxin-antitoxin system VapC family toxin [Bacteroidia bacterium]
MAEEIICLDTSILIGFFRSKQKESAALTQLSSLYSGFAVLVITLYEIYAGSTENQRSFWDDLFAWMTILPFDIQANEAAVQIYKDLKSSNKLIEIPDIFIAATALSNRLRLATANRKHFERIHHLALVDIPG